MKWTILIYLIGSVVHETTAARQIASSLTWINQFNRNNTIGHRQSCGSCNCGVTNTRRRIIGGQIAQEYMYPWIAFVRSKTPKGMGYCGGAVMNSKYVVTAAHCIKSSKEDMSVILRVYDLTVLSNDILMFLKVDEIIKHPGWDPKTLENDIALLKLDKELEFTGNRDAYTLRPICMPTSGNDYVGKDVISIGWGDTTHGQEVSSTKLKEAIIKVAEQDKCKQQFPKYLTDNMICAGEADGSVGTCQGDSGGPLFYNDNGAHEQVGVVAFGGTGCRTYSVYTRMDKYLDWIADNSKDGCSCPRP